MDFGFGALIEKFEEYFGKRATRAMLVLIGLAIAAGCIGLIWTVFVSPLLTFLQSPLWERTLASLFLAVVGIGAGIGVSLNLVTGISRWRRNRQLKAQLDEARRLLTETETQSADIMAQAGDTLAQSASQLDKVAETTAESRKLMEMAALTARAAIEMNAALDPVERLRMLAEIDLTLIRMDEVPSASGEKRKKRKPRRRSAP